MPLPNLIVIGGQKCGSSSLHSYLDQHPQISMSRIKELNFFAEALNWKKGLDWYQRQFAANDVMGESSVIYSRYPRDVNLARRMYEVIPEAKILYLVRDPVERLRSQYLQHVYEFRETRSFSEVLQAIFRQDDREYLCTSSYYLQVSQYLKYFKSSQIRVVFSEDLSTEPDLFFRGLFQFLGVDDDFSIDTCIKRNSSRSKRIPNQRALKMMPKGLRKQLLWPTWMPGKAVIGSKKILRWTGRPLRRPKMSAEEHRGLREVLADDVRKLRDLSGRLPEAWGQY